MKNLKISRKIALLLSLLTLLNMGVAVKLITSMSTVNDQGTEIATNWLPAIEYLGAMNTDIADLRRLQLRHILSTDDAAVKVTEEMMAKVQASLDKDTADYAATITTDKERGLFENYKTAWASFMAIQPKFLELSRAQRNDEAKTVAFSDMLKDYTAAVDAIHADIKFNQDSAQEASDNGDRIYGHQKLLGEVATVVSLLTAIGIVIALTRNIATPIQSLKNYMGVLQAGNYDQEVPLAGRKDEIGEMAASIQSFRESLIANREMEAQQRKEAQSKLDRQARVDVLVTDFDAASSMAVTTVAAAATELSQTASEMSDAAVRTSDQVGRVAVASNQTSGTVQSVAAAAEEMSASVNEISKQVSHSVEIVREAMAEAKAADATSQEMLQATRTINVVTEMIQSIAGQINLLALNATIESARAGEAGRGFAVVASEVKTLANQTAKATEDIRSQLEGVQGMAQNVADALVRLTGSVEKVNEVSGAIAAAVEEQTAVTQEIVSNMNVAASGVEEINGNIDGIRQSASANAAATQQILGASSELSKQAESLSHQVSSFLGAIKEA